ncbi:MAG: putative very-long-chain fatty acid condensing enzyme [Monoraphidium minutum]|nr:MAG: putative very-long-chain fatty acid condensing enzyme [Monoraphidium minutum]
MSAPRGAAPTAAALPAAAGLSLAAQTQYTLAAAAAALVLRKLERLACEPAPPPPAPVPAAAGGDALLCGWRDALRDAGAPDAVAAGALLLAGLLAAALLARLLRRLLMKPRVYIVDFAVHKPHPSWLFSRADVRRLAEDNGQIAPDDIDFMDKLAYRSGLADRTAVVPAIQQNMDHRPGVECAREEYEATCFAAAADVLAKAGVAPGRVKFVITNSSLFNPTPSLSAALINHFGMPDDTINYSLGGMGCSAGVVALDLARELLQNNPGNYALVVSHENITNSYYTGSDKSMLVANTLFRANGAAVLLSSRPADAAGSKYTLRHIVRTNMAADDEAYRCVWQTDDAAHNQGVSLKKELIGVAGRAVARNMARLGPLVLPVSEQLKYAARAALRAALKRLPKSVSAAVPVPPAWRAPYTPNFSRAFDAACIHTGGRGVIDSMEKNLGMSKDMVEASRAALYRFGNTSSCSVWYELAYVESATGLRRGARVWQIAFGSGFKCNSAVLVANRTIHDAHAAWEGFDRAAMYKQLDAIEKEAAAARARKAADRAAAEEAAAAAAAAR